MLYLRTGANGSCKSLFTLKDLRDKQVAEGRSVCVLIGKPAVGTEPADPERRYLKIYPKTMQEFGWTECHYSEWWAQPDGTIFLGDECHNYLPKRANGSAVPEYVAKLAEHRSRGFDFFLLTQHPSNIDSFVVKIIGSPGWHQHLKRAFGASNMTTVLQWSAVNNQCEKDGAGKNAQVTMRPQPKEVYGWYDSAELHTGKRKIPRQAKFLVVAALVVPVLFWYAGKLIYGNTIGRGQAKTEAAAGSQPVAAPAAAPGGRDRPQTAAEYVAHYRPRIAGLMHTAPAYDELTQPKRVPVPAACVQSKTKGCKCYTQDATPYPMDDAMCRRQVEHGSFLAFAAEGDRRDVHPVAAQPRAEAPGGPVAASNGLTLIGALPQAAPAAPAPADPQPQRIASVRR